MDWDKLTFPSRLELQVQLKKSPCLFLRAPHTQRFAEIYKKIFPFTKPRAIAGKRPIRVFVMSKKTYEFGPLIVPGGVVSAQSSSFKKNRQLNESLSTINRSAVLSNKESGAQDTMTFTNTGIFPAEVSLSFGKEKETNFSVTPNKFTLSVGETANVVLRAAPETIGEVFLDSCCDGARQPHTLVCECLLRGYTSGGYTEWKEGVAGTIRTLSN
ncbi:hypothetical protein C3747_138g1 [Trypanosoma cruzi]|uniref:Abnormal spindle-like microcephaly-associated protein ASH domain-containing protein n=1 Tax=Trypanosoma cruzi TaxID=5693 RepID=A0A2V2WEH0_TRYCR|nr:hypothetical protein C3747_138g1 [Trypanosoma cruzi]